MLNQKKSFLPPLSRDDCERITGRYLIAAPLNSPSSVLQKETRLTHAILRPPRLHPYPEAWACLYAASEAACALFHPACHRVPERLARRHGSWR